MTEYGEMGEIKNTLYFYHVNLETWKLFLIFAL